MTRGKAPQLQNLSLRLVTADFLIAAGSEAEDEVKRISTLQSHARNNESKKLHRLALAAANADIGDAESYWTTKPRLQTAADLCTALRHTVSAYTAPDNADDNSGDLSFDIQLQESSLKSRNPPSTPPRQKRPTSAAASPSSPTGLAKQLPMSPSSMRWTIEVATAGIRNVSTAILHQAMLILLTAHKGRPSTR